MCPFCIGATARHGRAGRSSRCPSGAVIVMTPEPVTSYMRLLSPALPAAARWLGGMADEGAVLGTAVTSVPTVPVVNAARVDVPDGCSSVAASTDAATMIAASNPINSIVHCGEDRRVGCPGSGAVVDTRDPFLADGGALAAVTIRDPIAISLGQQVATADSAALVGRLPTSRRDVVVTSVVPFVSKAMFPRRRSTCCAANWPYPARRANGGVGAT